MKKELMFCLGALIFVSFIINVSALRIFVTNSSYNGNLGGTTGADQLCMNDANKPNNLTYKALIGTLNRSISGSDWVLKANTTYTRVDTSIIIKVTNSQKWFTFNLNNSIANYSKDIWTGLSENGTVSSFNCNNWRNTTYDGMIGKSLRVNSESIEYVEKSCSILRNLYCVEQ